MPAKKTTTKRRRSQGAGQTSAPEPFVYELPDPHMLKFVLDEGGERKQYEVDPLALQLALEPIQQQYNATPEDVQGWDSARMIAYLRDIGNAVVGAQILPRCTPSQALTLLFALSKYVEDVKKNTRGQRT